jgi:phosphoglycerate dehydrogenase-like enzyme
LAFVVLKAAAGLDQGNLLQAKLGAGFAVREYDPASALRDQVADVEAMLLRDVPVPAEVIDAAPKLRLLQRYGQHFSGVDIAHALSRGIHVARIPPEATGSNRQVAEHTLFLLLAVAKRYGAARTALATRRVGWPKTVALVGKTLGMIGVGKTGEELARLAVGFGMKVIAVKRTPDEALARALGMGWMRGMAAQEDLLAQSDVVSIHLPLEPATVGYFGRAAFAAMKPGAILLNIARGPIVDRAALLEALASGRLAGAGLDVLWDEPIDPADPLLRLENVVVTPHIAAQSSETQEVLAELVAQNILAVARGEAPRFALTKAP